MTPTARAWLLPLLLWLAGCANDPDEIFTYSGTVLSADRSSPLAGQTVELLRADNVDCTDLKPYRQLVTDADGGWATQLYRGELELPLAAVRHGRCVEIGTTFASGAHTRLRFTRVRAARIPPLFEWVPSLAVDDGGVTFTPIETAERMAALDSQRAPFPAGVTHELTVTAQGLTLLTASDVVSADPADGGVVRRPITLPTWAYQGFDTTLGVVAKEVLRIDVNDPSLGDTNAWWEVMRYTPAAFVFLPATSLPVSRGATCPPLQSPCVLTDGELAVAQLPPQDRGIDFALPSGPVIQRVVLHGSPKFEGDPLVELRDPNGVVLWSLTATPNQFARPAVTLSDHTPEPPATSTPLSWTLPGLIPPANDVKVIFPGSLLTAGELSLYE